MIDAIVNNWFHNVTVLPDETSTIVRQNLGIEGGYLVCRMPSTAIVKNVEFQINGGTILVTEFDSSATDTYVWEQFLIPETSSITTLSAIVSTAAAGTTREFPLYVRFGNIRLFRNGK